MRLDTAQRRRSWAWWGAISFALLIVGAYLLFDILDVDGSQLTRWPAGDIIVVGTQQAEADRVWRIDLAAAGSFETLAPGLPRCVARELGRVAPTPIILRVRQSRLHPRANLHRNLIRSSSPVADPA